MGFTMIHYVKMAIWILFHKKTFYGVEAGITDRVICYRNAGIFVENYVCKLTSPQTPVLYYIRSLFPLPPSNYSILLPR